MWQLHSVEVINMNLLKHIALMLLLIGAVSALEIHSPTEVTYESQDIFFNVSHEEAMDTHIVALR